MRYFIDVAYKGTHYHGWQLQPNANSVQEELQKALKTLLQSDISIVGAGRTDAGVHAKHMVAHFDYEHTLEQQFVYQCNSLLPDDIVVFDIRNVSEETHARFSALSRSYEYHILLGRDPFLLDTTWQIHQQQFNIELMNEAANVLMTYTDFECFSKSKTDVHTFDCAVTEAYWKHEGNRLTFYITANRFLRNMVRAIVGTLLDVGLHKISIDEFKSIIESKNRSNAGVSVPAKGLFLTAVRY